MSSIPPPPPLQPPKGWFQDFYNYSQFASISAASSSNLTLPQPSSSSSSLSSSAHTPIVPQFISHNHPTTSTQLNYIHTRSTQVISTNVDELKQHIKDQSNNGNNEPNDHIQPPHDMDKKQNVKIEVGMTYTTVPLKSKEVYGDRAFWLPPNLQNVTSSLSASIVRFPYLHSVVVLPFVFSSKGGAWGGDGVESIIAGDDTTNTSSSASSTTAPSANNNSRPRIPSILAPVNVSKRLSNQSERDDRDQEGPNESPQDAIKHSPSLQSLVRPIGEFHCFLAWKGFSGDVGANVFESQNWTLPPGLLESSTPITFVILCMNPVIKEEGDGVGLGGPWRKERQDEVESQPPSSQQSPSQPSSQLLKQPPLLEPITQSPNLIISETISTYYFRNNMPRIISETICRITETICRITMN